MPMSSEEQTQFAELKTRVSRQAGLINANQADIQAIQPENFVKNIYGSFVLLGCTVEKIADTMKIRINKGDAPANVAFPAGQYRELTDLTELTILVNEAGSARIDVVYVDPTGGVVVETGVPGAGVPAIPDDTLKLYELSVPASTTSNLNSATLTDKRVYPSSAAHMPAQGLYTGQFFVLTAADSPYAAGLYYWDGSAWGFMAATGSGPALTVPNGGTGLDNLPAGRIPYGNGANPFGNTDNFSYKNTGTKVFRYGKKIIHHGRFSYVLDRETAGVYATVTPLDNSYQSMIIKATFLAVGNVAGVHHGVAEIKFRAKKWTTEAPEVELLEASRRSGLVVFCVPQVDGDAIKIIARKTSTGATWVSGQLRLEIEGSSHPLWYSDNFIPPDVVLHEGFPEQIAVYEEITGQYFRSNIGIGTINPQAPVHAVSTTGKQLRLEGPSGAVIDFEMSSNGLSLSPSSGGVKFENWNTKNFYSRKLAVTGGASYYYFSLPHGIFNLSIRAEGVYRNNALYAIAMSDIRISQALIVSANDGSLSYTISIVKNGSVYDISVTPSTNLDALSCLAINLTP